MPAISAPVITRTVGAAWLVSAMIVLQGCEKTGSKTPHDFGNNSPNVCVAVGDSITAAGYPAVLSTMIEKTVMNDGVPGATSGDGADRVHSVLVSQKPGYLLILYGANDVIRGDSIAGTVANLRTIVRAAIANKTVPVIATLTPMIRSHAAFAGDAEQLSEDIRQMADEEGVSVADLYSAFDGNDDLLQPDGLHPTAEGNQVIAETFADALP